MTKSATTLCVFAFAVTMVASGLRAQDELLPMQPQAPAAAPTPSVGPRWASPIKRSSAARVSAAGDGRWTSRLWFRSTRRKQVPRPLQGIAVHVEAHEASRRAAFGHGDEGVGPPPGHGQRSPRGSRGDRRRSSPSSEESGPIPSQVLPKSGSGQVSLEPARRLPGPHRRLGSRGLNRQVRALAAAGAPGGHATRGSAGRFSGSSLSTGTPRWKGRR